MAERETEHVRMVDAGRMRAAYAPMSSSADVFESVRATKFQCVAHGNTYGFSFVAASTGGLDFIYISIIMGVGDLCFKHGSINNRQPTHCLLLFLVVQASQ